MKTRMCWIKLYWINFCRETCNNTTNIQCQCYVSATLLWISGASNILIAFAFKCNRGNRNVAIRWKCHHIHWKENFYCWSVLNFEFSRYFCWFPAFECLSIFRLKFSFSLHSSFMVRQSFSTLLFIRLFHYSECPFAHSIGSNTTKNVTALPISMWGG